MERRLLTFFVASTAFFFFYISLRVMFAPPPKKPNQPNQIAEVEDPQPGDPQPGDPKPDDPKPGDVKPDEPKSDEPKPEEEKIVRPRAQWITMGSMAADSQHWMLVTFKNQGGGVERIELTERNAKGNFKYRRVDVRSGYLGYFAGVEVASGVLVNVVGAGTPAALAQCGGQPDGIQVGDVIIAVAGKTVTNSDAVAMALAKTRPGDEVSVEVQRGNSGVDDGPKPTTLVYKATLSEHPLDLVRLARDGGVDQIEANLSRLSCLVTLSQVNGKKIATDQKAIDGLQDPAELIWDATKTKNGDTEIAEFSVKMSAAEMAAIGGQPVRLKRTYSLAPNSYVIEMDVEVENLGDEPQKLAYRLEGANGITLEGWWYSAKISPNFSGSAARDVVYKTAAAGHELLSGYDLVKRGRKTPKEADQAIFAEGGEADTRNLKYIAVDAQYFIVGYLPPSGADSMTFFRRATATLVSDIDLITRHKERAANTSFYLDSVAMDVPPQRALRHAFQMFAGPKDPELLAQHELGDSVYYGWFAWFAKLLASLLHVLYALVRNYAVAIILLTVIVRAAMFPLSRKAAVNAQRMQELAPEFKKIAEQFKDDMEGRLKAQRELQQRVGFNPMAGCLPMFLQLPIFIGLYRALSVDLALRQEALSSSTSWCSNLAGPDMLYYWGDWLWDYMSGRGTGWLGPYFNILPVIVVVLFLAQQKMFMPPATDEQTRMTQKIMSVMTLMMGLFFFRVPAGLCLYFITSSLWGMCERILVKKTLPKGKHFDPSVIEGSVAEGNGGKKKKETLADKIRQHIAPQEEPAAPPNKRKRPPGGKKKR